MIVHCSNPDCRNEFTHNLETNVRLSQEINFISCPNCGEFIQVIMNRPLKKHVSSRIKTQDSNLKLKEIK